MKSKQLVLDGVTYEVKEPTVGVLFPILPLMEEKPTEFQMELAKASIFVNGQSIGDDIMNLGLSDYLKLITAVIEIAGMGSQTPKD